MLDEIPTKPIYPVTNNLHRAKILLCGALMMLSLVSSAQQYDKTWVLGDPMSAMTFEGDSVLLTQLPDTNLQSFFTIGSMCDLQGNLLFYTNGVNVYNALGKIMVNGDSLSAPSEYYDQVVDGGMPSREGVVILPNPGDTNSYYIFHYTPTDTLLLNGGGYESLNLYYSLIDMRGDSGRGVITTKNVPILQNELLSFSRLAACKHANGRDWWIIKNAWHENIYYEFLLTPNGVEGPFLQQLGPDYPIANEWPGYSSFSPDGSRYMSLTGYSSIVVMDFDRCSGLLSSPKSIFNSSSTTSMPISGGISGAFSPSGRFLYICDRLDLNQYDLNSTNINDSVRIETLTDSTDFYQMNILQPGPNNKMYLSCYNGGSYKMHVINQPDSFGLACNFQLYGQSVLSLNPQAIPYFPNYRLGALAGSCDTIHTSITDIAEAHPAFASIAPNPASDKMFLIFYTGSNTTNHAEMYDIAGRNVWSKDMAGSNGTIPIDLSGIANGMYTVTFTADGRQLMCSKLVVAR